MLPAPNCGGSLSTCKWPLSRNAPVIASRRAEFTPFTLMPSVSLLPPTGVSEPIKSSTGIHGLRQSPICLARSLPSTSKAYETISTRWPENSVNEPEIAACCARVNRRGWICASNLRLADRNPSISSFCLCPIMKSSCQSAAANKNSPRTPLTTSRQPSFLTSSGYPSFSKMTPIATAAVQIRSEMLSVTRQNSRSSIDQLFISSDIGLWIAVIGNLFALLVIFCRC